jgi:four helix bundle protein
MASARRLEDLIAWQLCFELQQAVFELTEKGPAARDLDFKHQIRRASASAADNVAEGFGRYRARDFARFTDIARGSLNETLSQLNRGLVRKYYSEQQYAHVNQLTNRAIGAVAGLQRYLYTCSVTPDGRPIR